MISALETRLSQIAEAYAPNLRFLAGLRIAFGLWVVVFPVDLSWVSRVPVEFFHPRPGLFALMHGPPSEPFLTGLTIATAILAALLIVGFYAVPVSLALSATLIMSSGISYSYSKVDHFILFELAPIFLAFAGWGWRWSIDAYIARHPPGREAPSARGMPILLYAITIGWAMLSAAAPKLAGGWLDPDRYGTRGYLARDIAYGEKLGPLGPRMLELDAHLLWKFFDYATLIAEGGLIFMVLFPAAFRLWLLVLASFHVGVYLMLGISFSDYILVYLVFFSAVLLRLSQSARQRLYVRGRDPART